MTLSSDAKFGIGVFVATVLIIGIGAYFASKSTPSQTTSGPVTETDRLVREDDPSTGSADAKVTVVEFGDFQCPSCGVFHPTLEALKDMYSDASVRFVYRHFPLTQIHEHAQLAAEASLEAQVQGKFWEYHDLLFENQTNLDRNALEQYAQELGLNMNEFQQALDEGTHKAAVTQDVSDGNAVGVRGTPTIYINNAEYTGARSAEAMKAYIDSLLAGE